MDRLNNIASYFNEKERKRLDNIAKNSPSGLPEMTVSKRQLAILVYMYITSISVLIVRRDSPVVSGEQWLRNTGAQ